MANFEIQFSETGLRKISTDLQNLSSLVRKIEHGRLGDTVSNLIQPSGPSSFISALSTAALIFSTDLTKGLASKFGRKLQFFRRSTLEAIDLIAKSFPRKVLTKRFIDMDQIEFPGMKPSRFAFLSQFGRFLYKNLTLASQKISSFFVPIPSTLRKVLNSVRKINPIIPFRNLISIISKISLPSIFSKFLNAIDKILIFRIQNLFKNKIFRILKKFDFGKKIPSIFSRIANSKFGKNISNLTNILGLKVLAPISEKIANAFHFLTVFSTKSFSKFKNFGAKILFGFGNIFNNISKILSNQIRKFNIVPIFEKIFPRINWKKFRFFDFLKGLGLLSRNLLLFSTVFTTFHLFLHDDVRKFLAKTSNFIGKMLRTAGKFVADFSINFLEQYRMFLYKVTGLVGFAPTKLRIQEIERRISPMQFEQFKLVELVNERLENDRKYYEKRLREIEERFGFIFRQQNLFIKDAIDYFRTKKS